MENDKDIIEESEALSKAAQPSEKKKKSPEKKKNKPDKTSAPDTEIQDKEMLDGNETPSEDDIIDAPSIDSLLLDDDDTVITNESTNASVGFEEFMADYKARIEKSLAMAKSAFKKKESDTTIEAVEDEEAEALSDIEKISDIQSEPEEPKLTVAGEGEAAQFTMDIAQPTEPGDTDEPEAPVYNPEKPRIIDTVFDFAELFIFTLAAVLIITNFFFKHTIVDGGSMMNTLYNGEHLIVSDLFYTPERGDIIVFADYTEGQKSPYVKRVIGIPGDRVSVDETGNVTVNGEPLDESDYVFIDGAFPTGYEGKNYIVKEGEVFVLGDHRNASYDSASFPYTAVKTDSIIGKVLFRIYPFDSFGFVD